MSIPTELSPCNSAFGLGGPQVFLSRGSQPQTVLSSARCDRELAGERQALRTEQHVAATSSRQLPRLAGRCEMRGGGTVAAEVWCLFSRLISAMQGWAVLAELVLVPE